MDNTKARQMWVCRRLICKVREEVNDATQVYVENARWYKSPDAMTRQVMLVKADAMNAVYHV